MNSQKKLQHNREEDWVDYIESLDLRMKRLKERQKQERDNLWVEIEEAVESAYEEGVSVSKIAMRLKVSRQTVFRYLKKQRAEGW